MSTVKSILSNEKYKGDACLQKTFVVDFLTKKSKKNEGERRQYYVHNHHPAIIEPEVFDLVQEELKKRSRNRRSLCNNSPFTTKIICADCGGYFGHKIQRKKQVWYCNHRYDDKNHTCETPIIPEDDLKTYFVEALGQVLARVAATEGAQCPDPAEEAMRADRLASAHQTAKKALETALEEFRQEFCGSKKWADSEEFQKKHSQMTERIQGRKEALEEAGAAILANSARKEKCRRFVESTTNLTPEGIEFSDNLFIATVEEIRVSKVRNGVYTLEYNFTNGEKVKLEK